MFKRSIGMVATLALGALLAPVLASAQSTPRTTWGDPDLRGVWNNGTLTPFQRPEALGTQEYITEEEAATAAQRRASIDADLSARGALRTEAGGNVDRGVDGAPGSYNNFWMERGTAVVADRRTSVITDPPNGRLPDVTSGVRRWMESDEARHLADVRGGRQPTAHYNQLDLGDRCIWYRGVPSFPTAYNNNYQIFQTPDWIAITQEHIHDTRFIPLDGRPSIPESIRQYAGDSRGRWEGDTLVVETTHFNEHAFIRNFSPKLSQELHVVERFTPRDDGVLGYEFTVTDPKTWTRPWSGSLPMTVSSGPMFEYACHEGNYGMTNMLAGSRVEEAGR